ncbi:uncharacterized protein [Periplaneta americana]|uniref:uncharacterized protein n=1 Tax=Periplaneta americana TaxID=6978 RepID=UPI0037E7B530
MEASAVHLLLLFYRVEWIDSAVVKGSGDGPIIWEESGAYKEVVHHEQDLHAIPRSVNSSDAQKEPLHEKINISKILSSSENATVLSSGNSNSTSEGDGNSTTAKHDSNEEEYELIQLINTEMTLMLREANDTTWKFILDRNKTVGLTAINKSLQYTEFLIEMVNRSTLLDELWNFQNDSENVEFLSRVLPSDDVLLGRERRVQELKQLYTLLGLYVGFTNATALLIKNKNEYYRSNEMKTLEHIADGFREIIQLINAVLSETRDTIVNFISSCNVDFSSDTPCKKELLDLTAFDSQLQNQTQDLEALEKLLEDEKFRLSLDKYIKPATQGVVFLVGVFGNGFLLIKFLRHKEMRTTSNLLILNLTLGDFLSLLMMFIVFQMVDARGSWDVGVGLCRMYKFLGQLCLGVCVYFTVVISIQKCFMLTDFLRWRGSGYRVLKDIKPDLVILCVWFIGSVLSIDITVNSVIWYDTHCRDPREVFVRRGDRINFITFFVVPLIIIAISSGVSARQLHSSIRSISHKARSLDRMRQARLLSSDALIVLSTVFTLSYIPHLVVAAIDIWYEMGMEKSVITIVYFATFTLIFTNTCFSPLTIYVIRHKYREYIYYR